MKLRYLLGRFVFWCGWPFFYVVLRDSTRSRVMVICDNDVLVVKGWHGGGKWSFPGGGIKKSEQPNISAAREVLEETGIKIEQNNMHQTGSEYHTQDGIGFKILWFEASMKQKSKLKPQALEIGEVAWLPMRKLNSTNASSDALRQIASYTKGKVL